MVEGKKNLPGEAERFNMAEGFELLSDLAESLLETKGWVQLQGAGTCVQAKEEMVFQMLDGIDLSEDTRDKLADAIFDSIVARDSTAVLYGMRTAMKLVYAFTHPFEMSDYFNAKRESEARHGQAD